MKIKLLSLISLIVFALNYNVSGQVTESKKYPFLPGNYYTIERQSWDVNDLTTEIGAQVSQTDLNVYAEYLTRVFIVKTNASLVESKINLSTIQVRNKHNSALRNDYNNFNVINFNPLKYFFNFYSPLQMNYQVDNSDYMIVIVPSQTSN
jgi:hypothetical protein